ncbi:MAG: hypothetical protein V4736_04325 [Bdellovibrionota bacterium]
MNLRKLTSTSLAVIGMLQSFIPTAARAQAVERPPQYVLLAFDGSYNNDVWESSRAFSTKKKAQGVDVRFSYFINPVYLLWKCPAASTTCKPPPYTRSDYYNPPGYRSERDASGKVIQVKNVGSAIGWGDNDKDISWRIENMNNAFTEGHEIGSHAVGHFDGSSWSYEDWKSEFNQFYSILDKVFEINKISPTALYPQGLAFRNDIVGFRAPVLGFSPGMYQALPEFGLKYDTSQQDQPTYWPQMNKYGTWNFPLAGISRPGSARTTPSMDYNFCYVDSAALLQTDPGLMSYKVPGEKANTNRECLNTVRPEQKVALKKNMMTMYMNYFNNNYYGNRAPVSIGHHFSRWVSGAYYETFFEFAEKVCGLPEVKCVTTKEYMEFMNSTPNSVVQAYRSGAFAKLPRPKSSIAPKSLDLSAQVVVENNQLVLKTTGRDTALRGINKSIYIGTTKIHADRISLSQARALAKPDSDLSIAIRGVVYNRQGEEIQSATHRLEKVGTANEILSSESVEQKAIKGHMTEAHTNEVDFDETNSETFGH